MGQRSAPDIRRVRFTPPTPRTGDIEVNTLSGIRERGGPQEFLTPQRLDFDLLVRVESGSAVHTVDFAEHRLGPGDVLWVRAGQVHRWGAIDDIEGTVVMFGPHAVDERTHALIRSDSVRTRNHWSAADLGPSPVPAALDLLVACAAPTTDRQLDLHHAGLAHALATMLVQLSLLDPPRGEPGPGPSHEAYGWFRDHLDEHFASWHQVTHYAERLGYSTRTLNRLARRHTGLSAKELIDERVVLEAKRQLSHADASVAEVAEMLGFDDASNFSSYFRRHTGTTPAAFRVHSRGG